MTQLARRCRAFQSAAQDPHGASVRPRGVVACCAGGGQDPGARARAALAAITVSAAILLGGGSPADAVLSSPNAKISRTVDSALRRSIPAFNPEVKVVQDQLERIAYYLRIPQTTTTTTAGGTFPSAPWP
ncbi:Peptidyl-prolyl cis-trans isomerase CYP37, chloroplastic [Tetrabaena socialis]|uniref:Peptidyl-prolyl cis-trans isomerase CYP37, chloroplastic n=1 Tax=Tetrabaena socialis TaxID=47790 RepID=A0A2J7ZSL7_9CHLO|nr:Peptidyl-prolyl cis-trans isomerase CYP37, chloroplastic [Tetrabaena socialis]|eukprot:PNH03265.1 Peptidyl-prolyl cis-trans isomerase CYP37, chloroplastic [Tetrabaena socialis]